MKVGKTLYVTNRKQWRSWLSSHHKSKADIWLIYYRKKSGKRRIPYGDAVEEALCYGWIDSVAKPRDNQSWVQRFTPRREKSHLSETNKERVRRLMKAGKMTRFGLERIRHDLDQRSAKTRKLKDFLLPADIIKLLKSDLLVWKNFAKFPKRYQHVRVAWIDGSRNRPDMFARRLRYLMRMTAQNKKFGMVQ